ncbi:histidine kinase [Paenibacillus sp. IITD108]
MGAIWKRLFPQKLKYRLFMSFFILILIPFSVLHFYNYQRVELVIQQKISEKSHDQLEQIIQSLEDVMSIAFKTWIMLEQDLKVKSILLQPEEGSILGNKREMEEKFTSINNSLFLLNPFVYYTVLDLKGNIYTSFQPRRALKYDDYKSKDWFSTVLNSDSYAKWITNDENYVSNDISSSKQLLSMYMAFKDKKNNMKPYGIARISIDYNYWFKSVIHRSSRDQSYFMVTGDGEMVAQSSTELSLSEEAMLRIIEGGEKGYFIDKTSAALVNYSYIPTLDWYMVNRTPSEILFSEIEMMKSQYFLTFAAFMALFIMMTFIISSTITRPLYHLQKKMRDAVHKSLRIRLPQDKYSGEILELTRTFNTMLDDMNTLIQKLKEEERQKEAVHFRMLLSQMNPHFLLNTLNTMKWSAIRSQNEDIEEMCVALGKLLEMSLNSEIDMIHLKDELELVQAYVHIQQIRFKYNLEVEYEGEEDTQFALVPKFSIQPLVENSIRHGIGANGDNIKIKIKISKAEKDRLRIDIIDNGIGLKEAAEQRPGRTRRGIGISNLKERLELLFKEKGHLILKDAEAGKGTHARIEIPLLLSMPYEMLNGKQQEMGEV